MLFARGRLFLPHRTRRSTSVKSVSHRLHVSAHFSHLALHDPPWHSSARAPAAAGTEASSVPSVTRFATTSSRACAYDALEYCSFPEPVATERELSFNRAPNGHGSPAGRGPVGIIGRGHRWSAAGPVKASTHRLVATDNPCRVRRRTACKKAAAFLRVGCSGCRASWASCPHDRKQCNNLRILAPAGAPNNAIGQRRLRT